MYTYIHDKYLTTKTIKVVLKHYGLKFEEVIEDQPPKLKGKELEDSELTYVIQEQIPILSHLSELLNSGPEYPPTMRLTPKMKEFKLIKAELIAGLQSSRVQTPGELRKFNVELQQKLIVGWSEEYLLINPRAVDFTKRIPVAHLVLYLLLKIVWFTLGFDLNRVCQEFVDMIEQNYVDIASFVVSPEFLDSEVDKNLPRTLRSYAQDYFEAQKDWFIDHLNSNGVMYQAYKTCEKTGKQIKTAPDHAPVCMLPSRVLKVHQHHNDHAA